MPELRGSIQILMRMPDQPAGGDPAHMPSAMINGDEQAESAVADISRRNGATNMGFATVTWDFKPVP